VKGIIGRFLDVGIDEAVRVAKEAADGVDVVVLGGERRPQRSQRQPRPSNEPHPTRALPMELGELKPPTSWVRSRRALALTWRLFAGSPWRRRRRPEARTFGQVPPFRLGSGQRIGSLADLPSGPATPVELERWSVVEGTVIPAPRLQAFLEESATAGTEGLFTSRERPRPHRDVASESQQPSELPAAPAKQ
jgi:hypothetical protein